MSKVLIISTHFLENLELATLPWVVGNAALAGDKEVTMFLQGPAVLAARKACCDGAQSKPFPELSSLVDSFRESGGDIYLCGPCMKNHNLAEADVVEGVSVAGAGFLVELAENADSTFTY